MMLYFYSNVTNNVTAASKITNIRINLQIYFNHVVYGISKYDNPTIINKLVGPTNENTPNIPCNSTDTVE